MGLCLCVALAACGGSEVAPGAADSASAGSGGDSGRGSDGTVGALGLSAARSESIPTVFTARWEAALTGASLRWTDGDDSGALEVSEPASGAQVIVGMKPDRTYTLTLDGGAGVSESVQVTTGSPPESFPVLEAQRLADDSWDGVLVTTLLKTPAAVILDRDGDYLWWHENPDYDLGGHVLPSADGLGIWTANVSQFGEGFILRWVSWDGSEVREIEVPEAHHDYFEHSDGTIAMLARDPRDFGDTQVSGDAVIERAPDGTISQIFSAWDAWTWGGTPTGGDVEWPHANAIDYLAEEDAYLVSFLTMGGIARIDRGTGAVDWVVGGEQSTFVDPRGSTSFFDGQHQLEWLGGALLVFVNALSGAGSSRAVEVSLDEASGVATETWSYAPDPPISSSVLGDVSRLDDGSTLVTFSFAGEIHQIDRDGALLWTLGPIPDVGFGYATLLPALTLR